MIKLIVYGALVMGTISLATFLYMLRHGRRAAR